MKDYNVVAEYISRKYIKRISGRDFPERVVGDNPELTVMVGTLAEERVEQAFDDGYKEDLTRQFESIPSISLSFQIDKNASGKLKICSSWSAVLYCSSTVRGDKRLYNAHMV